MQYKTKIALLQMIDKKGEVTRDEITKFLKVQNADSDIYKLCLHNMIQPSTMQKNLLGQTIPQPSDKFILTDDGADFVVEYKEAVFKKWENRFWKFVPILVSLASLFVSIYALYN